MKKKRTISIKDSHLRKIRNNLRSLLIQVCGHEQGRLQEEEENVKNTPGYYESDSPKLLNRVKELNDQFWSIERPLRASILLCPACFQSDKDMTFNPVLKTWYCTDCYAKLKKGYAKDGQADQFP